TSSSSEAGTGGRPTRTGMDSPLLMGSPSSIVLAGLPCFAASMIWFTCLSCAWARRNRASAAFTTASAASTSPLAASTSAFASPVRFPAPLACFPVPLPLPQQRLQFLLVLVRLRLLLGPGVPDGLALGGHRLCPLFLRFRHLCPLEETTGTDNRNGHQQQGRD